MLKSTAVTGEGVAAILDAVDRHRAFLDDTGLLLERRRQRLAQHTREVVNRALATLVWDRWNGEAVLAAKLDDVVSGRMSPYRLARNIVADLQEERGHGG